MINCKDDLLNTYIKNDMGELHDLFMKEVTRFDLDVFNKPIHNNYLEFCNQGYGLKVYGVDEMASLEKTSKQLTLADFKPKTKVEYVIVDYLTRWERVKAVEEGDALFVDNPLVSNTLYLPLNYTGAIGNFTIYRRIETEVTWQSELKEFLDEKMFDGAYVNHLNISDPSDNTGTVKYDMEMRFGDFIEMCHLVSNANK